MNLNNAMTFNPKLNIDFISLDSVENKELISLRGVVSKFNQGVSELRVLLEEVGAIIHCATSQGKDSTLVELMALEAYKQSIAAGKIEADRPLILSTVDTGGEAIPMRMYVSYARKRIMIYAKKSGINLHYDIVKPSINDEYFVRFNGGQKLIPNPTRKGDCSVILKVEPSEKYVRSLLRKFEKTTGQEHASRKIISCIGSRSDESTRRANNMAKQGVSTKSAECLLNELQVETIGNNKLYKFAPIKDWATSEVFDALRLAGDRPLKRAGAKGEIAIPSFVSNFGLLLEIYGNGSNETCEISVGATASSGCNGKARFGCVYCTMVAVKDHSSSALSELTRWRVLGTDNALRVRDYLFRLSTNLDARALHARAYDPVAYNRVALQPNTLKPKYLEKMVRYASQLSLDSIRIAKEFKALVDSGREMEHAGYRDIADDMNIPPKTKSAFLEMYKESVQDPECLNMLFSEQHALILSFRWAIDGIAAAPFRALAIWKQLEAGKGWIPYPQLNTEYESIHGALTLKNSQPLPEAVMMPIFKNEDPIAHAASPIELMALWQRPNDASDVFDEDTNCSITRRASYTVESEVSYTHSFKLVLRDTIEPCPIYDISFVAPAGVCQFHIQYIKPVIHAVKLDGKVANQTVLEKLLDSGFYNEIEDLFYAKLENLTAKLNAKLLTGLPEDVYATIMIELQTELGQMMSIKREVTHLRKQQLFSGYSAFGRKVNTGSKFTRRVARMNKGTLIKGNTRMSFYALDRDSQLHTSHKQETVMLSPDFSTHTQAYIGTHATETLLSDSDGLDNIMLCSAALERFREVGGIDKALELHDSRLKSAINNRHKYDRSSKVIRTYAGTTPAEILLAHGVISINKSYWQQLQFILKRTQIFDSLGMFALQSLKVEDVAAHPNAITMKQHRQDKATVLKIIRKNLNSQRKMVKDALASNELCDITPSLNHLESTAITAVNSISYELNSSLLKLRFDTHDIAPGTRAAVSSLWLAIYFTDVAHVEHVMAKLLTGSQYKMLKDNPNSHVKAANKTLAALVNIKSTVDDAISAWLPVTRFIDNYLQQEHAGRYTLADIKQGFESLAPAGALCDDILSTWKPNEHNMLAQLTSIAATIQGYMKQMTQYQSVLNEITQNDIRQITQKMTLSDKLALINKRLKAS